MIRLNGFLYFRPLTSDFPSLAVFFTRESYNHFAVEINERNPQDLFEIRLFRESSRVIFPVEIML